MAIPNTMRAPVVEKVLLASRDARASGAYARAGASLDGIIACGAVRISTALAFEKSIVLAAEEVAAMKSRIIGVVLAPC